MTAISAKDYAAKAARVDTYIAAYEAFGAHNSRSAHRAHNAAQVRREAEAKWQAQHLIMVIEKEEPA